MWQLHNISKTYKCRPSELVGLGNTHAAFSLDRACAVFSSALEEELNEVEGKKKDQIKRKRDQILRRWFPEAREEEKAPTTPERKYRDPGSRS
jgi:hypothetical protein